MKERPEPTPEERTRVKAKFDAFRTEVQAAQEARAITRPKRDMAKHDRFFDVSKSDEAMRKRLHV